MVLARVACSRILAPKLGLPSGSTCLNGETAPDT